MKIQTSHQMADLLVFHYSKYDSYSGQYYLNIESVPEFDLNELASLIIKEDMELGREATSCDNPNYETTMLPALIKYLSNPTDLTARNDFDDAWLEGTTKYLHRTMQNLVDDQCRERAFRCKERSNYLLPTHNRETGNIEWRA